MELNDDLSVLIDEKKMSVVKNYHNWPSRSLMWTTDDGINRKIEVSLEDNMRTFQIIGYAWYDASEVSGTRRFIKVVRIRNEIAPPLRDIFKKDIYDYIHLVETIRREDLHEAR